MTENEVKQALDYCSLMSSPCEVCPYKRECITEDGINKLHKEALEIIESKDRKLIEAEKAKAALEKDVEIVENKIIKVETQRDALLEELRRLADCSTCKFNTPDAVDGCSALMPCKDGSMWEWKGVKNEN